MSQDSPGGCLGVIKCLVNTIDGNSPFTAVYWQSLRDLNLRYNVFSKHYGNINILPRIFCGIAEEKVRIIFNFINSLPCCNLCARLLLIASLISALADDSLLVRALTVGRHSRPLTWADGEWRSWISLCLIKLFFIHLFLRDK